jgi:hypothetical protein
MKKNTVNYPLSWYIAKHRDLWDWLAKHPSYVPLDEKKAWPGWEALDDFSCEMRCFLCQYVVDKAPEVDVDAGWQEEINCSYCPVDWGHDETLVPPESCRCETPRPNGELGYHNAWQLANSFSYEGRCEKVRVAKIIRDLPLKEDAL